MYFQGAEQETRAKYVSEYVASQSSPACRDEGQVIGYPAALCPVSYRSTVCLSSLEALSSTRVVMSKVQSPRMWHSVASIKFNWTCLHKITTNSSCSCLTTSTGSDYQCFTQTTGMSVCVLYRPSLAGRIGPRTIYQRWAPSETAPRHDHTSITH